MNREEFMAKLKALLGDIPADEREEALQYYEDYFDDAGADNEAEVIRELESPQRVAAMIKNDLKHTGNDGEFTENGYEQEWASKKEVPQRKKRHCVPNQKNGASDLLLPFLKPFFCSFWPWELSVSAAVWEL